MSTILDGGPNKRKVSNVSSTHVIFMIYNAASGSSGRPHLLRLGRQVLYLAEPGRPVLEERVGSVPEGLHTG